MILCLGHSRLEIYKIARILVKECYKISRELPPEERYNLIRQINRAAVSVILNIAEGSSRKSLLERKRFLEISRGSLIEIDTALQVCVDLSYLDIKRLEPVVPHMNSCFRMLSKMISIHTK